MTVKQKYSECYVFNASRVFNAENHLLRGYQI